MAARFENLEPTPVNFWRAMRWFLTRKKAGWPAWIESPPGPAPPRTVQGGGLRVTYVNHATVLIQSQGRNLLTDPHWGERCSPVSFAGPRRVRRPGIRFEDLPPIHAVLLSHNHYDHLDRGTLRRLGDAFDPLIFTGEGVERYLPARLRRRAVPLSWWQSHTLSEGLAARYVPARHFSARGLADRMRSLWGGFVLEAPGGGVYFAGDTGYGRHFKLIRERCGPLRLAILPVGAYLPRWFMQPHHMDPDDAVKAFFDLGAAHALGVHFGTFELSDEPMDEPVERLELARASARVAPERFRVLDFGQGWDVPA